MYKYCCLALIVFDITSNARSLNRPMILNSRISNDSKSEEYNRYDYYSDGIPIDVEFDDKNDNKLRKRSEPIEQIEPIEPNWRKISDNKTTDSKDWSNGQKQTSSTSGIDLDNNTTNSLKSSESPESSNSTLSTRLPVRRKIKQKNIPILATGLLTIQSIIIVVLLFGWALSTYCRSDKDKEPKDETNELGLGHNQVVENESNSQKLGTDGLPEPSVTGSTIGPINPTLGPSGGLKGIVFPVAKKMPSDSSVTSDLGPNRSDLIPKIEETDIKQTQLILTEPISHKSPIKTIEYSTDK